MLDSGNIEVVEEFSYLGLLITSSGRMDKDYDRWITLASREFGALHKPVFLDKNLSLAIRRSVCIQLVSCLCCCMVQNTRPH